VQCNRCQAKIPEGKKACPACGAPAVTPSAGIPNGARLVITKAPETSTNLGGFGRTMMDMGPSGAPTQVIFAIAKPEMIIGRTEDNDIQLNHSTVSRHHAKICFDEGAFWIADLGTVNGTKVNDVEVELRRKLASSDQIKIGKFLLTFLPPGP